MINLQDAAVVSWPEGQQEAQDPPAPQRRWRGATYGALWGFLFGLIPS